MTNKLLGGTFFPNRSLLLRVLMGHQRGVSEKTHTKRAAARALARPAAAGAVWKIVGFYHQSQISSRVFRKGKICNGKNKGLALLDPFSYCFKMTLQKNVLLIDLRPCFHFYFSLLLQKTFLLIDLRPCFHFDDLLESLSIHLHYTLTLCTSLYTYTRNFKRSWNKF